jgi:dTDP-4-dehydrorhamnose reductase
MITKDSKILVTGVKGQLGFDCVRELTERGYKKVLGIDKDELDITDEKAVDKFITDYQPDVVMHNAAWTAVDKAEQMPDAVYKVNALGPKYIAEACKKVGAVMFYISTDYVFDGKGTRFFETTDPKNGLSVYGKTKSEGEDFVTAALTRYFIIRISWVFGINGHNFIKTMISLADSGKKELSIVDDQIGSPTYTYDLSKLMCDMMVTEKYGTYHATNEGVCSWAEFADFIFKTAGLTVKVNPVSTEEYRKLVPNQAARPLNSRMSKESLVKAGFKKMPTWQDATERYIHDQLKR